MATHKGKARTAQLGTGFEVQAQGGAQVHMVAHIEVKGARCAPAAHFHITRFVHAHRHTFVRQIRHAHQKGGEFLLDGVQTLGAGLQLVGNAAHFSHDG